MRGLVKWLIKKLFGGKDTPDVPPQRRTSDPPGCTKNCIPNNPYSKRTREENLRSKRSYEELMAEHQQKLADYKRDPYAFDNQGLLRNAPNDAVRQSIIQGRIQVLERQIAKHAGELAKINDALGL
ncbi:MAG: hypothetical protein MUD11_02335 [Rhodobacteraceae bacterium]|jgi:hypothetical protein|nr:hypothetical protein [Paracoccaceae bacterium]